MGWLDWFDSFELARIGDAFLQVELAETVERTFRNNLTESFIEKRRF